MKVSITDMKIKVLHNICVSRNKVMLLKRHVLHTFLLQQFNNKEEFRNELICAQIVLTKYAINV
jgi:hypothetical protein